MVKKPSNTGKQWAKRDIQQLQNLAKHNTPTRVIALKLERTEGAVRSKASELDISLHTTPSTSWPTASSQLLT